MTVPSNPGTAGSATPSTDVPVGATGGARERSDACALPDAEIAELAAELRIFWRSLARGTHLSGGAEAPQRQAYWVLGILGAGPQRMGDLAERARTSQASVTGIIDRLEDLGFVERVRSGRDRRVVEVSLTSAGRTEMRRVNLEIADRLGMLLEPLDAEETRELLRLFRKMTNRDVP